MLHSYLNEYSTPRTKPRRSSRNTQTPRKLHHAFINADLPSMPTTSPSCSPTSVPTAAPKFERRPESAPVKRLVSAGHCINAVSPIRRPPQSAMLEQSSEPVGAIRRSLDNLQKHEAFTQEIIVQQMRDLFRQHEVVLQEWFDQKLGETKVSMEEMSSELLKESVQKWEQRSDTSAWQQHRMSEVIQEATVASRISRNEGEIELWKRINDIDRRLEELHAQSHVTLAQHDQAHANVVGSVHELHGTQCLEFYQAPRGLREPSCMQVHLEQLQDTVCQGREHWRRTVNQTVVGEKASKEIEVAVLLAAGSALSAAEAANAAANEAITANGSLQDLYERVAKLELVGKNCEVVDQRCNWQPRIVQRVASTGPSTRTSSPSPRRRFFSPGCMGSQIL